MEVKAKAAGVTVEKVGRIGGYSPATLPGDISASQRYFIRDIISPDVELNPDGTLTVPRGAGLGFGVDVGYAQSRTEGVARVVRERV